MSSSTSPRARAREDDERRADIAQVLELLDLARIAEIPIDRIPALLLNLTALRSKTETVETILVARLAVAAALPSSPSSGPNYRECISASEAGRRLSLPKLRVYQLAREGLLPAVRIGRQVRFRVRDLAIWLEQRRQKPVDNRISAPDSNSHDRRRTSADSEEARAYTARIRGPRRPPRELASAPGEERDWHARVVGTTDTDAGEIEDESGLEQS
jgi:excisionase family DNA binding protein